MRTTTAVDDILPLWARFCDAAAVSALAVAAAVLLSGGFVMHLGLFRVSSHSIVRPLVVAALFIVARHAVVRVHPLHRRLAGWIGHLDPQSAAATTLMALSSRLAVLLVGYFAVLTIGFAQPPPFTVAPDPFLNLPARQDAGWYGGIALEGYRFDGRFDQQQNVAFFPAYPMLMRAGGYLFGAFDARVTEARRTARVLWAGTFVSILAFGCAGLYLRRLAVETVGEDRASAAVLLLAAYPFAVFFSAAYTESLFLLGCVAAYHAFGHRHWWRAAAWGALVGFTRPNGCLLSVVLACLAAEHLWRNRRAHWAGYPIGRAVLAASTPGLAMLAHSAFLKAETGAWFGWAYMQQAWGRASGSWALALERMSYWAADGVQVQTGGIAAFDALNTVGLLFAVAMIWPVFRQLGLAAAVFILINVVPPFLTGGVLSMGRFTSTLFPMFLALAAVLPRPLVVPIVMLFALVQGLVAALFFTWRPMF